MAVIPIDELTKKPKGKIIPIEEITGFKRGERSLIGSIFERPGATARAAIQEQPALGILGPFAGLAGLALPSTRETTLKGARFPEEVPRFQELGLKKFFKEKPISKFLRRPEVTKVREILQRAQVPASIADVLLRSPEATETIAGLGVSAIGLLADIAANPADIALLLSGQIPAGGGRTLGGVIAKTPAIKALGRFGVKERGIPGRGIFRRGLRLQRRALLPPKAPIVSRIKGKISETQVLGKKAIQQISQESKATLNQATTTIKSEVDSFRTQVRSLSEKGAIEFQKKLPSFFRRNSQAYGKRLAEISDDLARRGEGIKRGEFLDILDDTIREADEALLTTGRPRQKILDLADRINEAGAERDILNLKEVLNEVRAVRKLVTPTAQRGVTGFTTDDVIVSILNKNFGNVVQSRVPAFKQLQSSYSRVIKAMKESHKVFKPFGGEFQTKTATGFLERAGLGKLEAGERRLLQTLEKGKGFGKGVGKVSQPVKQAGKQLQTTQQKLQQTRQAIKQARQAKEVSVTKKLEERIGQLKIRKEKTEQILRIRKQEANIEATKRAVSLRRKRRFGRTIGGIIKIGFAIRALQGISRILSGEGGIDVSGGQ